MRNRDLDIKLLEQLPPWYREVLDYQEICQTEQQEFDALAMEINAVSDNFFFQTMGLPAIKMWEDVFDIAPDPASETVEFRRHRLQNRVSSRPPYTMTFLARRLDAIIGPGKWTVRMDYPNYTLYIESSAENQLYANELSTFIGKIKPAHIVYLNTPKVREGLKISEEISGASSRWNYRLGSWSLYSAPFRTTYNEEVVKLTSVLSAKPALMEGVASFVSGDIHSARINGSINITALTKSVDGNTLTVTYSVAPAQTSEVTKAELLDTAGEVLTASGVYVPVGNDGILMKHTISVKEGS